MSNPDLATIDRRAFLGSLGLSMLAAPLADWVEHLKACGVALRDGPVKRNGAEGPIDSIYLDDPDQNSIEVSTYRALSSR